MIAAQLATDAVIGAACPALPVIQSAEDDLLPPWVAGMSGGTPKCLLPNVRDWCRGRTRERRESLHIQDGPEEVVVRHWQVVRS